jgi:hypothetical protein
LVDSLDDLDKLIGRQLPMAQKAKPAAPPIRR